MPDTIPEVPKVEPGAIPEVIPDENNPVDVEAIKAELKTEMEAIYKSQISGLDKTVTKLQKEKEDLELSKLDEEARKLKELEIAEQKLKDLTSESDSIKRDRVVDKHLDSTGLPLEFAKRIIGVTEAEIIEDVKNFKIFLDDAVNKIAEKEINDRLSGKSPKAGETPAGAITLEEFSKKTAKERSAYMVGGGKLTE